MHPTTHRLTVLLGAICGLTLGLQQTHAQDALGDGRALDSNLRVGSGGRNPEARDYRRELAYRNAIVTGNVPGGFAFRGDVGYTAANDFRGATGSDELFAFQRDAFLSGLATRGIDGIASLQSSLAYGVTGQSDGLMGNVIINRPSASLDAGDLAPGSAPQRIDIYSTIGGSLRAPSAITLQDIERPSFLNTLQDRSGTTIGYIGASDLMGLRAVPPTNSLYGSRDPLLDRDILERLREDPTLSTPLVTDEPQRPDLRLPTYQKLMESLGIPTRIEDTVDERIDDGMDEPVRTTFPLGGDPLAPVREALREAERRDDPFTRSTGPVPERVEPVVPEADDGGAEDASEETFRDRLDRAVRAAEEVLGRSVDIDALGTTSEDPAFLRHFDRGVELLEAGRFFDAEERFAAALQLAPGDPNAAIGRLHAQIGAGMFLSAGANLRRLLVAYPEFIAARVDAKFLPSGERLAEVRELLRLRMGQANMMNADASALLAYMGVQTDNRADVEDGIARYVELTTDPETGEPDTLASLLEAAWLSRVGAGEDDPEGNAP
ncbi:MAG: hypothetical protein Tsb0013_17620 [Phycisphaerales bacterium]